MTLPESLHPSGPWLGVVLVQVTLVAGLGLLAWLAARRGGPALRGAVLASALAGLLIVPGIATVAPVWLPLPELVWLDRAGTESTETKGAVAPLLPAAIPTAVSLVELPVKPPPMLEEPVEVFDDIILLPENIEAATPPAVPAEVVAPPVQLAEPSRPFWSLAAVLAALWLFGALVCLSLALGRLALLHHWVRRARPVREEEWIACLKSLAEQFGLGGVALRESPAVDSPLTLGLFHPVILLPTVRRTWSAEQRVFILAHELAHVRRRDYLGGLVAELAACLCWFHPLVRWLAGRLRLEQEYAADAWAASAANDSVNYVRCLARLALELSEGRGSLAPAFWRRRPEILRRIDMLRRNPNGQPARLGRGTAWTVALLAAAACVVIAGVGPLRSAAEALEPAEAAPEAKAPANADLHGDPLPTGALARLGTTRWRHGANITFVTFGPDGKTLITAGQDNTVRLWDMATGKEIRRFARPQPPEIKPPLPVRPPGATPGAGAVPGAPVGADEKDRLKAEQARREAEKKLAEAQAQLRLVMRGDAGGLSVALAPDGKTLAIANANVIQLYEVATGKEVRKIEGPSTGLASLLFSPDGRTLAARGADEALIVWETDTGKEIRQIKGPPRRVPATSSRFSSGMAFTPDSKALAAALTEYKEQTFTVSVKIWDVASGKEVQEIKAPEGVGVSAVAYAPGGKILAYGAGSIVYLHEADSGKEVRQIKVPDGVVSLLFSPDGKALATRGRTPLVHLWETETGKELRQLGDAGPPQARGGAVFIGFPGPEARNLAFSPDGKQMATTSGGTVRLWDAATGKELPLTDGHQGALAAVAISADGKTAITWGTDRIVRCWDATTGKLLGAWGGQARPLLAALSADGRTVALANAENTISLHDAATGKELHKFKGPPPSTASALAFSPDGKLLAARGGDSNIRLYDVGTGNELRQITAQGATNATPGGALVINAAGRGFGGSRAGLAFSPDGKLLASPGPSVFVPGARSARGTINFYDVITGKQIRHIEPSQAVVGFVFSPDGRALATENADQSISLWEVASGKERANLGKVAAAPAPNAGGGALFVVSDRVPYVEPAGPVALAFSPDGRALVARGPDRTVRIWDVASGKEVAQAKGHEGRVETITFAPNGKTIASGSSDTTVLLWDAATLMKDFPKVHPVELPAGAVEPLWNDLAGEDAVKALQGVLQLAGDPKQAVPFLSERLKPAAPIDLEKVERWLADLESEKFAVRQEAIASLQKTGEQVVPALQKVLTAQPTIETRKRVEELLDKLTGGKLTAEQLRLVRAVEVLERAGTADARRVLETLAGGAPGALPTREAQVALGRLNPSRP